MEKKTQNKTKSLDSRFWFLDSREGFTLIEILIVVAIIGILASVVLVGLGPVQRRGRDARRISDLRQVQTGLELYYSKNGSYPPGSSWSDLQAALNGATIGVSTIPSDPSCPSITSSCTHQYKYAADSGGTTYVLEATLEEAGNPAVTNSPSAAPSWATGITCDHNLNYCVEL